MRNNCPKCEEPLVAYELNGVEIDHCLECRGTWLDSGELEQISHFAGAADGVLHAACARGKRGEKTPYRCPRCSKRLRTLTIDGEDPVVLDNCPRGCGLWFDRGEMRDLIAAHSDEQEEAVASFFADLLPSEAQSSAEGEEHA